MHYEADQSHNNAPKFVKKVQFNQRFLNFFNGYKWYLGLAFAFNEWKMVSFGYNHVYVASSHVPVCSSEVD